MATKAIVIGANPNQNTGAAPKAPKNPGNAPAYTPTTTTTVKQPAAPGVPDYNKLMAQAATQASTLAAAQIAAQIKAITDQQDQLRANASAQAQQINQASLAAAQFLSNLGDKAQADYGAAVNNLTGMTQGFTGSLRDSAQQAADAAQAQLSGIAGNTQTIQNRGPDLANLLYGVSGYIPANALQVQGLGAVENARAIPAQTIGYGQSQASGTLATGNTAADALNAQIAQIRATLPQTTQTYLSQFEKNAQDAVTNARNAQNDYWSQRNIVSEINTRTRQGKLATAKYNQTLIPHVDRANSMDGILRDQFNHPITQTINGIKYLQTTPNYVFDKSGHPVPRPKPTDPLALKRLAADWTAKLHYIADSDGHAVPGPTGHIQPIGGWVPTADGQSTMPPPKPVKPFIPKPINLSGKMGYIGQDAKPHLFYQADGKSTIPFPTTGAQSKLINVNGFWEIWDPSTKKIYAAHDEAGNPLPAGTPRPTPATHFGGRYAADDGYWHVYNTTTGEDKNLGTRPPKKAPAGTWYKQTDEKTGQVVFIQPSTGKVWMPGVAGHVPATPTGPVKLAGYPGFTAATQRSLFSDVSRQAIIWSTVGKDHYHYDGFKHTYMLDPGGPTEPVNVVVNGKTFKVDPVSNPPKDYDEALQWALAQGPNTPQWGTRAKQIIDSIYPMDGSNGRPLEGGIAITVAATVAKQLFRRGATWNQALAIGLAMPYWRLDPSVWQKAVAKQYTGIKIGQTPPIEPGNPRFQGYPGGPSGPASLPASSLPAGPAATAAGSTPGPGIGGAASTIAGNVASNIGVGGPLGPAIKAAVPAAKAVVGGVKSILGK